MAQQGRLDTTAALAEPRPGLALDGGALLAYLLRARVPGLAAGAGPLRVRAFAHGQSNPTYLLEQGRTRLVLRKKPPGRLLASAHAVEREHAVLAALAAASPVPVPRPLALCEDASVVGTPFYVMEFAEGTVFTDPAMPGAAPASRSSAYAGLADTLAALHAVDPAAAGLSGYGEPARYCARQVERWARQYAASVAAPCPRVARLVAWLRANVPAEDAAPRRAAVVHGDYRLDNLVYGGDMQVVAVLDWELSTLGNPWSDVAYACLAYHMPQQLAAMRLPCPLPPGVPDEAALLARYCAARGVSPPPPREWAFYLGLSLFRLLAILAGVQARARQGNASSAHAAAISRDEVLAALTDTALGIVEAAGGGGGAAAAPAGLGGNGGGGGGGAPSRPARPPAAVPALGAPSARAAELLSRVRCFIAERVLPAEGVLSAHAQGPARWSIHPAAEELKAAARDAGLWNLWLPRDMGARLGHLLPEVPEGERGCLLGAGLSNLDYAHLCGAMGRSVWAPEVFNCSAPDTGNMEVLARYGTPEQQRRWLVPLLRGSIRSCFAMTEKAVASSDATNITASIARDPGGGSYVVSGVKWWTSGAMDPRCEVAVFMGKTDPSAPPHLQQSMILVPMAAPGVKVVRPLLVYGYDDAPHGHAEVHFDDVLVPEANLLLGEGRGFEIAQGRLGPGRLHHCMRLMGAGERALELMATRALARVAFGRPLAAQGGVREKLARCRVALEGARLLVLQAAYALDEVGHKEARGAIAAAKVAAPAVALDVLDAAVQLHGGAGVCQDTPLAHLWAAARTLRIADGPDEVHLGTLAKLELASAAAAGAPVAADGRVSRSRL
ncbi:MAG: acyl-CoA dehydrogenase [Monoraphidium minutum]|nr:MAG: acyl-CoA dehydrogenase [Monoraphidium minutum]